MGDGPQEERRKKERFFFREHVFIDKTIPCTISDISETGLYISAVQQFDENRVVSVTIPFKDEKITVQAQVQYYQPGIGMGVRFIALDEKQKAFIQRIIESFEDLKK